MCADLEVVADMMRAVAQAVVCALYGGWVDKGLSVLVFSVYMNQIAAVDLTPNSNCSVLQVSCGAREVSSEVLKMWTGDNFSLSFVF
nr:hypothetical protein Iba_chr11cCG12930 [Ipomoea batatas]